MWFASKRAKEVSVSFSVKQDMQRKSPVQSMGRILTFDIEEPLLTEPLLDLPSGQAGGLDQPVDLMQHKVLKVKISHLPPWCCWFDHLTPSLPYLFFLGERTLGVAGPQNR